MAGLAPQRGSIGTPLRHAFLELTAMRIGVTCRAGAILEVEWQNLVRAPAQSDFVTCRARDSRVRPGQRKTRVTVLGYRERGSVEVPDRVAILAAILIGRRDELLVVGVLVTIRARRKFHLVDRVFARGRVALFAGHGRMFPLQRIAGGGVLLDAE